MSISLYIHVLACYSSNLMILGQCPGKRLADLISISLRVAASRTTSLIQGGGVMGRLSCALPLCLSQGFCNGVVLIGNAPCPQTHTSGRGSAVVPHPGCNWSARAMDTSPPPMRRFTCIFSPDPLPISRSCLWDFAASAVDPWGTAAD